MIDYYIGAADESKKKYYIQNGGKDNLAYTIDHYEENTHM
jgi:hypothetical protein